MVENSNSFTYILQHPQSITHEQTEAVKSIIDTYPYFQSARAIYLKGLKNQSSIKYNEELKTTAAYTTDRSILFDFITSDSFIQNEISQFIKQNTAHLKDINVNIEDISINKSVAIDEALKQQIQETQGVLDPALFEPKDALPKKTIAFTLDESKLIENVTEETRTQEATAEDILSLGKPLQFDKSETHSFNEWLKLTRFKPIDRSGNKKPESPEVKEQISPVSEKAKKFQLIDKFIAKNPKINPSKSPSPKGNLAKAQMIQPEALMTETLARIYVEQKNYKKAIQSYKILSLKYPEKSSFFANQIKAVEQLQEQNK
ncbi:hypothetical protein [uncultured Algibacter sp.]|uniref:hypothetical protein n=1 Tax=uncultured Algibacter sp. TaxID=298659 RepID=UPI00262A3DD2|nr:hypothetical protein [uncultured Algibacter sp.]